MKLAFLPPLIAAVLIMIVAFAENLQKPGPDAPTHEGQSRQAQTGAGSIADGRRVSIAPGGTFEFKKLKIAVLAIKGLNSTVGAPRYVVSIRVQEGGATEEITARPRESFNWHGYHVAIPAVHGPGEPGGGRVELAVTTVASLPQCVGKPIGKDSPWPCR